MQEFLQTMNILIAPDKFKGTLSAREVSKIIAEQLKPLNANITCLPMADGGEGTAEALSSMLGMSVRTIPATDSLMHPIEGGASYYVNHTTRTVAIDSSAVLGLSLIDPSASSPLSRTSFPLGKFLLDIIEAENPQLIYIGIGGTSTVDGGEGFLKALGYDEEGSQTHLTTLPPIIGLSDVAVPLVAPQGSPSSLTFAPQKGTTLAELPILSTQLHDFQARFPHIDTPFAGAGGGLGFALAVAGAKITLGADYLIHLADLPSLAPDIIITGEGSLDAQTSLGKVVGQLTRYGNNNHIPVIAIGGRIMPDFDAAGIAAAFSTQLYAPQGCLNYHTARARLIAAAGSVAQWIAARL